MDLSMMDLVLSGVRSSMFSGRKLSNYRSPFKIILSELIFITITVQNNFKPLYEVFKEKD